jgi:hypothetical protein
MRVTQNKISLFWLRTIPNQLDLVDAANLLASIVDEPGNLLNQSCSSRSESNKLIETKEHLLEGLRDAWEKKSFSSSQSLRKSIIFMFHCRH